MTSPWNSVSDRDAVLSAVRYARERAARAALIATAKTIGIILTPFVLAGLIILNFME